MSTHTSVWPAQLPIRVFLGSSNEQRVVAERLGTILGASLDPIPWWEAFPPGETTIGSLVKLTQRLDMAVFVIAPDDLRWKSRRRTRESHIVRDNVVFELGLFAGALGTGRSLMLLDESQVPDLPTDLAGITQVRWQRSDNSSLDRAASEITKRAQALYEDLGLGWWAVRFDNDAVDGRAFYGVFEMIAVGREIQVRYGNTHYAEAFSPPLMHRLRSTWNSSQVSLVRGSPGQSRLIILADVTSHAPNADQDGDATHLRTLIEVSEAEDGGLFRGRYFDVDGLTYHGRVTCRRIGNCDKAEAEHRARLEFAGGS